MNKVDYAMRMIPRSNFLPESIRRRASSDTPLPIGFGQTNSQPAVVRSMLKWLDPQPGDRILDIGSGSGWTTALLANLVGSRGFIYAVEKIPQLVGFGARNCERLSISNVRFIEASTDYGLVEFAPYDRILVSAAARELPGNLVDQLRLGGRMVIPINTSIHVIDKIGRHNYEDIEYPGYLFVPLV